MKQTADEQTWFPFVAQGDRQLVQDMQSWRAQSKALGEGASSLMTDVRKLDKKRARLMEKVDGSADRYTYIRSKARKQRDSCLAAHGEPALKKTTNDNVKVDVEGEPEETWADALAKALGS